MDASDFKEYIFGMLFLKRCSDVFEERYEAVLAREAARGRSAEEAARRANHPGYYADAGAFFVPEAARWRRLRDEVHHHVGDELNKALSALEQENTSLEGVLEHIDFNRKVGQSKIPDKRLRDLVAHFSKHRLRNEDFEYPDLLGAAYEYLIREFADSAGKKGGEFYTPRSVVRMMVRIADPQEHMRVYDPCAGSGGMLVTAKGHLDEHRRDAQDLGLFGQESNGGVWSISKMNMLLHGIPWADLRNGDTLAEPMHVDAGELERFDRILTNPPFSQNYVRDGIDHPERFRYGFCPEGGKKADLMFVQHMLAVLRPKGLCVTVMPHGVLFRGGAEKTIRTGILDDDLLDAVIGLGPNLFYGTGIPACLLVLRGSRKAKPPERRGKVLFINADREYHEGRAQNELHPEHVEKIVATWRAFEDVEGFARVVSREALRDNDDNLNIRRYADNAPPPEPHDVRAHLYGGVPEAELGAQRALFEAHGLDADGLFVVRPADDRYLDFAADLGEKADLKRRIEDDDGVRAREKALREAVDGWWRTTEAALAELPRTRALMTVREQLLEDFETALRPVGLLDRFQVAGVVASWWGAVQYDLRTLAAHGFGGLVDAWRTSVVSILEDRESEDKAIADRAKKENPFDHRLVRHLLPDYLAGLESLDARKAELDATIKGATAPPAEDDEEDKDDEETLSEAEVKALRKELSGVRRKLKAQQKAFLDRLAEAREALDDDGARDLVLRILRADLDAILDRYVTGHRQQVVAAFERWWDKYRVTLESIETERDAAASTLRGYLERLGYA